ncbi:50S ribosomal protein L29 domain protein [Ancylostoma ceylanicum]|uniref:50S ribosomal protein L29 domain protein n=1 Tax=Ancylostoma ceylanicum TaxID=53326 RepID=A0A0D6LP01_9BILA|nr:50S ribosomal protein L29 domain protein [Ancylostoma ceylanicum]
MDTSTCPCKLQDSLCLLFACLLICRLATRIKEKKQEILCLRWNLRAGCLTGSRYPRHLVYGCLS